MKVLLLTWDFPPVRGGIQIWMGELARRLQGDEVHVLVPNQPGAAEFDRKSGISTSRLAGARLGLMPWLLELCARTLWRCLVHRPEVIVCGHVVTAPAALLARRLLGVPYVVFTHAYELRRKHRRRFLSIMLRNASIVIANSGFTRSTVEALGVPSERIRIVYPGVDAFRFTPRANGGVASDGPVLFSVARLAELYKGHDTVIRVLPLVRARVPGARLRIAGDGPLREYLSRIAHSVAVGDAVEFLGEVADDALPDLYRASDAFVLMSRESPSKGGAEGFGIVILEAGACGKPVVAGRSGGLVDAVEDGVTGILGDPEDPAAVAEALIAVLSDQALAQRMGQAGRQRVLARFTWDIVIGDARKVFEEAITRG